VHGMAIETTETVNDVGGEVCYVKDVGGENVEGIRVRRVEDGSMDVDGSIDVQGYGIPRAWLQGHPVCRVFKTLHLGC
jgi:hypothetical protein